MVTSMLSFLQTMVVSLVRWLGRIPLLWLRTPASIGLKLVIVSDTHGCHRKLRIPDGDVLIHAGDMTRMGAIEDAEDFNNWLGEQPHAHKLVILGNHEYNAEWHTRAGQIFSNATLLRDSSITLNSPGAARPLTVHGTNFAWPMRSRNPNYDAIPDSVDIVIAHGPVKGYADGGKGCPELLRLAKRLKPLLVVGGHIHFAHGVEHGRFELIGTTFVNAANAGDSHTHMKWEPVVLDI